MLKFVDGGIISDDDIKNPGSGKQRLQTGEMRGL